MIRIDEMYPTLFWPWMQQHLPQHRLYFCDPPGYTEIENLINFGYDDREETGYIFMHDQEPLQLHKHMYLWSEVISRTSNIPHHRGAMIVSERGEHTKQVQDIYGWQTFYYFFHGWAALDWYRGYDRNLLLTPAHQRAMPTRTFMSPNRIIGGQRDHRVLWLYHIARANLSHNHISAPRVCPYESVDIISVAQRFQERYPDILEVLTEMSLPRCFQGESQQLMTSSTLGNFAEVHDSMIYVPTETIYWGNRTHLTEKTMKALALGMPFVLIAPAGSLEYLREYGFQTFGDIWDETYDQETDDYVRLSRVTALLQDIDQSTDAERQRIWHHCLGVVQHNWNHFYGGGFEAVLDRELANLWHQLKTLT